MHSLPSERAGYSSLVFQPLPIPIFQGESSRSEPTPPSLTLHDTWWTQSNCENSCGLKNVPAQKQMKVYKPKDFVIIHFCQQNLNRPVDVGFVLATAVRG